MQKCLVLAGVACLAACASALTVSAQQQTSPASYPDDVHPESRNRLPLIARDNLDETGKALFDKITDDARTGRSLAGFQGPYGITLYSPRFAEIDLRENEYLRFESHLGRRMYELAILVTARELNQQFEWTAHEPAARTAGVEQATIDIIKYGRPTTGLDVKDAVMIQLGREVLARHAVPSATLADALRLFGPQDLVDAVSVIGHYAAYAVLLDAFDQRLAPGQVPLLPPK